MAQEGCIQEDTSNSSDRLQSASHCDRGRITSNHPTLPEQTSWSLDSNVLPGIVFFLHRTRSNDSTNHCTKRGKIMKRIITTITVVVFLVSLFAMGVAFKGEHR